MPDVFVNAISYTGLYLYRSARPRMLLIFGIMSICIFTLNHMTDMLVNQVSLLQHVRLTSNMGMTFIPARPRTLLILGVLHKQDGQHNRLKIYKYPMPDVIMKNIS